VDWKECVQKMIDYIERHLTEELTLNDIASQVGYSSFYCSKAFRSQVGICMKDYIRLRRISAAALELRDTERRILDIAFEYGYNSQEAFTRSFIEAFEVTPAEYRRIGVPIPLFFGRNLNHQHHNQGDDRIMQADIMRNVNVSFLHKPARKMLVWHQEGAADYHQLCDAEGAEAMWGLLASMKGTLGGVVAAWLNENNQTRYVWGVEMPVGYSGPIPEGLESIDAPECDYVKFCHPPYPEEMHETVTEAVWNISESWNPGENGREWNEADNPVYEDDREDEGYMVLKPVRRI
jgi:AraC family transcriptional regulator